VGQQRRLDCGARRSAPAAVDPAAEHDKLIVALASAGRVYRGLTF
jgi:hypothetical protein